MSENLHIAITGDNQGFINALNGARAGVRATAKEVEQSGGNIEQMFSRIKVAASGALATFSAAGFVKQVATIRGEFQQLEAAFTTLLGSAKQAQSMMADLTKLAATTPFDMQGVAQGAKQLLAYGVAAEDVTSTMRKLGDISAGLSLNLNDLVWLYGTTLTQGRMFTMDLRQFQSRGIPMAEELAKIFGVQKNEVAGLVTAGKVGSKEVIQAIDNMTKAGSQFGGLMDMQSHTITGQIRNIEDTIDMAFNDLGKQSEGIINDALSLTATLVDHWQQVGAAILYAAETIGLYKAASLAISRFETNATNMGYDAEIAQLATVIPQKEADANADLQQAVAEGKLTEAKAAKLAAMREEAQAYVQELQQKAQSASAAAYEAAMELQNAEAKKASAVQDLDAAQEKIQSLQEAMNAAMQKGDYEAVANARTEMGTAINQANTASQNVNTASKQVAAAQTKAKTTAQAAETAQTQLNTAQTGLNTAATAADTTAKGLWAQVTALATRAQQAFNVSMFASPLFWIAAVIAGVTFSIYSLATADSAAEVGQKRFNDELERTNEELEKRKQKAEQLIQTIQSETSTDFEKTEAYEELSKLMPSLTEKYSQAEIAALDFSKAQKDVGENIDAARIDEARKQVDELKQSIENVKSAMADDARWNGGRGGLALSRELESEQEQLERAENQILEYERIVEEARKQAEEASKPIEVKLEEAQQNYKVKQDIFDFYKEAMDLAEQLQAGNEEINYATGQTKLDEFIANAQAELEDLRKQEAKNPLDLNLRMREQEKTKVLNGILDMKSQMEHNGTCTIPLWFQVDWDSLTNSVNEAKERVKTIAEQAAGNNFGALYNVKKGERDTAYKNLQKIVKDRSKYTYTQYKAAKKAFDDAEKDFTQNYGGTSIKSQTSANNKSANAAQRQRQQAERASAEAAQRAERLKEENQKWDEETAKQRMESVYSQEEARIAAIDDAGKKEREERKLQYKKDKDQLAAQERDFRKQNYEHNKTVFENSAKGNKNKFTGTIEGTALTADQQAQIDAEREKIEIEWQQYEAQYLQSRVQGLYDYLKEYGSVEQQKYAISKEYDKKIAEESDTWRKRSLEQQKQSAMQNAEIEGISNMVDWGSVLGSFGSILQSEVQPLLERLQSIASSESFKQLDYQSQSKVYEAIDKLRQSNDVWDSEAFGDLRQALWDYKSSLLELAAANRKGAELHAQTLESERQLQEAQEKLEKAKQGKDEETIRQAEADVKTKQQLYDQANANEAENSKAIKSASNDVIHFSDVAKNKASKIANSLNTFSEGLRGLQSDSLEGIGKALMQLDKLFNKGKITDKVGKWLNNILDKLFGNGDADDLKKALTKSISKTISSIKLDGKDGKDITAEIGESITNVVDSFGKDGKTILENEDVKNAIGNLAENVLDPEKVSDVTQTVVDTTEKVANASQAALDGIATAGETSGNIYGMIIGAILQILDAIADAPEGGLGGLVSTIIDRILTAVAGIIENLLDSIGFGRGEFNGLIEQIVQSILAGVGKIIQSIIEGVTQIFGVKKGWIDDLFGIGGNKESVQKSIDDLTDRNTHLEKSIDDLKDSIDKARGANAISMSYDAAKLQRETNENYKKIAQEQARYTDAHHSWEYYWKGFTGEETSRLNQQFLANGLDANWTGNLWDLSPEQMKILRSNVDLWERILDTGKGGYGERVGEKLDEYIDQAGKLEEITEQLYENLTTTTEDNVFDDFLNSLYDLASGSQDVFDDIADSWQEMVNKMVINNLVGAKFQERLKEWYEQLGELNERRTKGEIGDDEYQSSIDELYELYRSYVKSAQSEINEFLQMGLIQETGQDSQSASANGASSITYDQTNTVIGLITAGNIVRQNIADNVVSAVAGLSSLAVSAATGNATLSEMRNLMIYNNSYLEDILKFEKTIYNDFSAKMDQANRYLKEMK